MAIKKQNWLITHRFLKQVNQMYLLPKLKMLNNFFANRVNTNLSFFYCFMKVFLSLLFPIMKYKNCNKMEQVIYCIIQSLTGYRIMLNIPNIRLNETFLCNFQNSDRNYITTFKRPKTISKP